MRDYGRIRRDRSVLYEGALFGRRRRRRFPIFFVIFYALALAGVAIVLWQFNNIQPRVLAMIDTVSTPTPSGVEYAQRGDLAYQQGNLDEAVANFRAAARGVPNDVNILYELARVLVYRSYGDVRNLPDIDEAVKIGEQAVSIAENNSRAHTIYCFALVRAGQTSEAVRSCLRALDLDPGNADAHAYLSMAYYDLGRTSSALEQAEQAVRLNPSSIDANIAVARALTFQGSFNAALQYYEKAANINPNLELPWFEFGGFAYNLGNRFNGDEARYRIAISAYNTVLKKNPNSVKAYTRLCQTYLAKGEPRDARLYCEKATEIDPAYAPAWRWLGEVSHKSRNYESAVEQLKRCSDLQQGIPVENRDATCWWLRGVGYFVLGDCDTARPILEDALRWMTDEIGIRESQKTLGKCQDNAVFTGTYRTPTPLPSPTPRPTPIL